jgi:hypothetical protein
MRAFRMKPMYAVLLQGSERMRCGLYHLYKATPDQLCRLHYSQGSLKAVKARLKTLVDEGYVQVHAVSVPHETPARLFFSARYFYTLAPLGVKYLAGLGYDIDESWRPHNEADKHGLFVAHTLELNDVLIAAALLKGRDAHLYLHTFTHERVLKQRPIHIKGEGRTAVLIPDAYLDFRQVGTKASFPMLLEHDRGTEERAHFKRKIAAYLAFLQAEGYVTAFETDRINIAFTTFRGEERLSEMRSWTRQALAEHNAPISFYAAFRFAALPRLPSPEIAWLEPRWYTPEQEEPQPLLAA